MRLLIEVHLSQALNHLPQPRILFDEELTLGPLFHDQLVFLFIMLQEGSLQGLKYGMGHLSIDYWGLCLLVGWGRRGVRGQEDLRRLSRGGTGAGGRFV